MNSTPPTHAARTLPTMLGARPRRSLAATGGALAALALGSVARAGETGPEAGPGSKSVDLAALSLSFSDSTGPGHLIVDPLGADQATGGTAVFVHIAQARGPFAGSGFVRQLNDRAYVIAATLAGVASLPGGPEGTYFLTGTLRREDGGWRGSGRWSAVADPVKAVEWQAAEWPAIQPPQQRLTATVRLESEGGSTAHGAVTLVALPDGETRFELQLEGLTPGADYALQLRAGTPAQPSASFTQVVSVTADQRGRSGADGLVRFRGSEPIALLDIAGGEHFLSVVGAGRTVAAGVIPTLQPLG